MHSSPSTYRCHVDWAERTLGFVVAERSMLHSLLVCLRTSIERRLWSRHITLAVLLHYSQNCVSAPCRRTLESQYLNPTVVDNAQFAPTTTTIKKHPMRGLSGLGKGEPQNETSHNQMASVKNIGHPFILLDVGSPIGDSPMT